jgi:phosphinothricin acetyltransferase
VRLHERLGFEKVAHFSEVGLKFGRWIDVGYWQLKLD